MREQNTSDNLQNIILDQKNHYQTIAEEYRNKFIDMEKEFIFIKENQRCAINTLRADLERQHKLEQKRLEAINILELQNFERFLDEKDAKINELNLENNNIKSKLKLQTDQYLDLQQKFNGLIDQSDQLTVQYRQLDLDTKEEIRQMKQENYEQTQKALKENTKQLEEQKQKHMQELIGIQRQDQMEINTLFGQVQNHKTSYQDQLEKYQRMGEGYHEQVEKFEKAAMRDSEVIKDLEKQNSLLRKN